MNLDQSILMLIARLSDDREKLNAQVENLLKQNQQLRSRLEQDNPVEKPAKKELPIELDMI